MIGHLKSPAAEFRDAILGHFRMRKEPLLEQVHGTPRHRTSRHRSPPQGPLLAQVRGWATDKGNSSRHATQMATLLSELENAMDTHL
jgi:hypothetical protein